MLGLLLIASSFASPQQGPPPLLQPKTYASPSSEWELFVDPTQRLGSGPGRYKLKHQGKVAWESEKAFTFWDAAVDERGYSFGYAYTGGMDGRETEDAF